MRLCLFEHMRLTTRSKTRKEICAYEKVCTYRKGALNNPSLQYVPYSVFNRLIMWILLKMFQSNVLAWFADHDCHSCFLMSSPWTEQTARVSYSIDTKIATILLELAFLMCIKTSDLALLLVDYIPYIMQCGLQITLGHRSRSNAVLCMDDGHDFHCFNLQTETMSDSCLQWV